MPNVLQKWTEDLTFMQQSVLIASVRGPEFQFHIGSIQALGYKHPIDSIRQWWNTTYLRLVNDAHLYPETKKKQMDTRLSDSESQWRAREEVTAR